MECRRLREAAASFDRQRDALIAALGARRVRQLEDDLETLAGDTHVARLTDIAGWLG